MNTSIPATQQIRGTHTNTYQYDLLLTKLVYAAIYIFRHEDRFSPHAMLINTRLHK